MKTRNVNRLEKKKIQILEYAFQHSAFRHGVSAFRFGLVPEGPSDHLPIQMICQQNEKKISAMSWNLLSQQHLYNNFLNITGKSLLAKALSESVDRKSNGYRNIYLGRSGRDKLHHFFSEFSQFLLARATLSKDKKMLGIHDNGNEVMLNLSPEMIIDFVNDGKSLLLKANDKKSTVQTREYLKHSRWDICQLLFNPSHPDVREFQLAILHALELIYHIQEGNLNWQNRRQLIANDKRLRNTMQQQDILCFQECTDPKDIDELLNTNSSSFKVHSHVLAKTSQDYCAIAFSEARYQVVEQLKFDFDKKKPCLLLKLRDRVTKKLIVVGSIHHPGGAHHNKLSFLQSKLKTMLQTAPATSDYLIFGDYNHRKGFFRAQLEKSQRLSFPSNKGTLAGVDFGNCNREIDAVLHNLNIGQVNVRTYPHLRIAPSNPISFKIDFSKLDKLLSSPLFAYPSYKRRVQATHLASDKIEHQSQTAPLKMANVNLTKRPRI